MLALVAEHLEDGSIDPQYDFVMVDEFQDASQLRARLISGLVASAGRHLLAVGDDWQSINRFAGADISVMTGFHAWFGEGETLQLTNTFRCPQSICDVAAHFVSKNPRQFRKAVRSTQVGYGASIEVILAAASKPTVQAVLEQLFRDVEDGVVEPSAGSKVSVLVLGRYHFVGKVLSEKFPPHLDVTFRTVHGPKGLEADYVVLPQLTAGNFGFPSSVTDNPVLNLVMVAPDPYLQAEERRLFYVALTRARRRVTLIAERGRESAFVVELIDEGSVAVVTANGHGASEPRVCEPCQKGTMVIRSGKYGKFSGCSTFPACKHTQKTG
jgi:DNA helicase-4